MPPVTRRAGTISIVCAPGHAQCSVPDMTDGPRALINGMISVGFLFFSPFFSFLFLFLLLSIRPSILRICVFLRYTHACIRSAGASGVASTCTIETSMDLYLAFLYTGAYTHNKKRRGRV